MYKRFLLLMVAFQLISCDPKDIQRALDTLGSETLSTADMANGLKQALEFGVDESVNFLSIKDGYYKSVYKILLPEEARVVIDKLKFIPGFSNVEEILLEKINRGAEDAAKTAGPIFLNSIKQMTFDDALGILMGEKNAATQYLHRSTYNNLYSEFNPVIVNSLNKFNALEYWADAIEKYNKIPFVNKVNPDLADHVTSTALVGLFDLVEKKELGIRTDISQRTTSLLEKVFKKQDAN
jgi:hypothetical protein